MPTLRIEITRTPRPVRFDKFFDNALYGPNGFYTKGGRPGLVDGDFVTSPERGRLFARVVARYLDSVWHEAGRPDQFIVIEGGAGVGTLCSGIYAAQPDCVRALRYFMVERSDALRQAAVARLAAQLDVAPEKLPVAAFRDVPEGIITMPPDVPDGADLDKPPDPYPIVVLANELLDNLAPRVLEKTADGWAELYIAPTPVVQSAAANPHTPPASPTQSTSAAQPTHAEVLLPAPNDASTMADAFVPDAAVGTRVPLQIQARLWVERALKLIATGRVLVFDYGTTTTAELAQRTMSGWMRTYAGHRRAGPATDAAAPFTLSTPSACDITCDVAFDQLPPGATLTTQADWLTANGLEELVAPARRRWQNDLANPTAETLRDRALLDEAADLTNPTGLGAFTAAEWQIP